MNESLFRLFLYALVGLVISAPLWWPQWQQHQRTRKQRAAVKHRRAATVATNKKRSPIKPVTNQPLHASKTGSPYGVKNRPNPTPEPPPVKKPPAPRGVPPQLLWKLDGLTKDAKTSQRLVDAVATRYPGKSRTWCTEKAIADLERDRRR